MRDEYLQPWRRPAKIHVDEYINSMVVRMARYGGMPVADFMKKYLKARVDVAFEPQAIRRLAIITGRREDALLAHSVNHRHPVPLTKWPMQTPWKRVAPGMLQADGAEPYARRSWSFEAFPCDLETGEVLLKDCPRCGKALRWLAHRVEACDACGFDLRAHPPKYWPEHELADMRTIARGMKLGLLTSARDAPISLPAPFDGLTPHQTLETLQWCALLRGVIDRSGISGSERTAYLGLPIARSWPAAMHTIADLLTRQMAGGFVVVETFFNSVLHTLPPYLSQEIKQQASDIIFNAKKKNPVSASSTCPRKYVALRVTTDPAPRPTT